MHVAIYFSMPEKRTSGLNFLNDKVVLTSNRMPPDFFHSAIAGRVRRSYRRLRNYGLTASEARGEIIEVLFATSLSDDIGYRVPQPK